MRSTIMTVGALSALAIPVSFEAVRGNPAAVPVPRSMQRYVQGPGQLYLPQAGHELVAADLDRDGDEDKTQIQFLPLTDYTGKAAAAAGGAADFSVEPVRPCVLLGLKFLVAGGSIDDMLLTTLETGDVNLLPAKGAIPVKSYFSHDSTDGGCESPLFGPGVALAFTIRNKHASTAATLWGVAKVASIIG
jgi:hypothetical protein